MSKPSPEIKKHEPWNPLLKSYPFSEKVNAVSIGAETLFTRLVAQADDYGNYHGEPRMIAACLFPHRWAKRTVSVTDAGRWRTELVTCPFGPLAATYSVNGTEYLHLLEPRRRFRNDRTPDIRFPREPANLEEEARSASVTLAARQRTSSGPIDLDLDLDKTVKKVNKEKFALTDKVIDYLNKKTGNTSGHNKTNRQHIHARLNGDGLTVDDCCLLIDFKTEEWLDNPKHAAWLNPKTLFQLTKWENNLNGARRWDKKGRPPLSDDRSKRSGQLINQRSIEEYTGGK